MKKNGNGQGYLNLFALILPFYSIKGLGCEEMRYIDGVVEFFLSKREFEYFMLKFGLKESNIYSMEEIEERMAVGEDYLKQLERQAISKLKKKRPKEILELFTKSRVSLIQEIISLRETIESFSYRVHGLDVSLNPNYVRIPVDEDELSLKTRDAFKMLAIETINDLLEFTKEDLLGQPGFGEEGLKEVKMFLGRYGLELKKKKRNG